MAKQKEILAPMLADIEGLIHRARKFEQDHQSAIEQVHSKYVESARNLIHYRTLRTEDISGLQKRLGAMSLSRLAKAESHLMASLQTNRSILKSMLQGKTIKFKRHKLSPKTGISLLKSNAKALLGYRSKGRRGRIMVTLPTEAASNYKLVYNLVKSGMNCARINCAHDGPTEWYAMIEHVRTASKKLGRHCKIAMDLGGPKIRTGQLLNGPKVQKYRPQKDTRGYIVAPLQVWMGPLPSTNLELLHIPISGESIALLDQGDTLYFRDAREKKRRINVVEKKVDGLIAACEKTTYLETGLPLYTNKDHSSFPILVGDLPATDQPILLHKGDTLRLLKEPVYGRPHQVNADGTVETPAFISCTSPAIFDSVKEGEVVLFDDGKIKGEIKAVLPDELHITIIRTPEKGGKLRTDKGINFPTSNLQLSGLTEKDRQDLEFVVKHADVVNMSFVNRPEDVRELYNALTHLNAAENLGVILKIETQRAFNHLTDILLEGMRRYPIGVMIARGDLAIEVGWDNIARVQEEILSLCQAAHVTDIWATQVLENLAKRGIPSRAEITDAAMAQRADCVMLNKGPHILQAIQLLDIILRDLDPYQDKNAPMLPAMERANSGEE